MSRIYWDTMLFAYLIEEHPKLADKVQEIHERMNVREDSLCTSVFTLGELLAGPYRRGATQLAATIRKVVRPPTVELINFTPEVADRYAQVRAKHRVAPADAIHLASAAQARTNLFLTNDRQLHKLVVPGIDFIAGLDASF